MTGQIELDVSVNITGGRLQLDYQIINGSYSNIYAYVLPIDGGRKPYHHQAYTCLSEDKSSVQLLLGDTPPPSGISVNFRAQPFAVLVPENGRYENYLKLQLPLLEWHAYHIEPSPDAVEIEVDNIDFGITYVHESQTSYVDGTGEKGFLQVGGYPIEKLQVSHQLEHPVKVMVRPEGFERFPI